MLENQLSLTLSAGRPAAITSDVAGTTRDVIETRVDLKGLAGDIS